MSRRTQRRDPGLEKFWRRSITERDLVSGAWFVYKSKRGDRLKVLAWQATGFALYARRLERGTFAFPACAAADLSITATQLTMILGGLEPAGFQQRRRYQRSA